MVRGPNDLNFSDQGRTKKIGNFRTNSDQVVLRSLDTAAVEKQPEDRENIYLKDVLPPEEYKEIEKDVKKTEMQNKLKV